MAYDELQAVLMPDGTLQLEWMSVAGRINRQQGILQNEIYGQYSAVPGSWFFFLGFCNKKINLSPSLFFWRKLSGLFIHKLSLTPDIEEQRGEVVIPLAEKELSQLIESAPLMIGGEYLHAEVVLALWDGLQEVFSQKIEAYDGSVEEFVKEYSPDVHLVGRIYFHLVENKGHEAQISHAGG